MIPLSYLNSQNSTKANNLINPSFKPAPTNTVLSAVDTSTNIKDVTQPTISCNTQPKMSYSSKLRSNLTSQISFHPSQV